MRPHKYISCSSSERFHLTSKILKCKFAIYKNKRFNSNVLSPGVPTVKAGSRVLDNMWSQYQRQGAATSHLLRPDPRASGGLRSLALRQDPLHGAHHAGTSRLQDSLDRTVPPTTQPGRHADDLAVDRGCWSSGRGVWLCVSGGDCVYRCQSSV